MTTIVKPPEPAQLKQIKLLSAVFFSDDRLVFERIGEPATREEASHMLRVIDGLPMGATIEDLREQLRSEAPDLEQPTTPPEEEPVPGDTKTCNKCEEEKPLDAFGKLERKPDGLNPSCKDCIREYNRERYEAKAGKTKKPKTFKKARRSPRYSDGEDHFALASGPEPDEKGDPEDVAATTWSTHFANPTLDQLRLLSQFLGGATLDETAEICEAISRR